jgi:transcriptional regulator with XRE-family HTH domain
MRTLEDVAHKVRARRGLPAPAIRRALREAAGLSQQDVAEVCGVTRAAVSRWESGERNVDAEHVVEYVALLELLRRGDT